MKHAVVYVDGASRGNPGSAAIGVVFQDEKGRVLKKISLKIGETTNNVAEYAALVFALQEAVLMRLESLQIFTDSELMAKQFAGVYKIKEPSLKVLNVFVSHLRGAFHEVTLTHIPREKNKLADQEANKALDQEFLFN